MLFIGLFVTIGIGSSFSSVPVLAVIYVPLCVQFGFSPLATVARGYAILQREDGRVVRRVDDVRPGDRVTARVGDGTLHARVIEDDASDKQTR